MKPCLAENWFVEDSMEDGTVNHPLLWLFHPTDKEQALREVYRESRDLRVKYVFMGQIEKARTTTNTAALELMETISVLIAMGTTNMINHRFRNSESSDVQPIR